MGRPTKHMARYKNSGRPSVVTQIALAKLELAFTYGVSDEDACFFAKISPDSLYRYQEKNPDYSERKKRLKNMPKFKARRNIYKKISAGDIDVSKWLLERTDEEFKPKTKQEVEKKVLIGHVLKQIQEDNQKERVKYSQEIKKGSKIESLEKLKELVK